MTRILGIETSCDETAAAVVADGRAVLSNVIASQHDLHARYGGVVPEIASRAHLERIQPVIDEALRCANFEPGDIDAVAVGNRPGLIGSLIVGVSAAKALAWSLGKPLIGVDHIRAHLHAASLVDVDQNSSAPEHADPGPAHPAVGLVVSGGHTSLYRIDAPLAMTLLGRTIDDAVGEAYDKAAVILRLDFPGGPNLDKLAQQGDPSRFKLPRSLLGADSLDFSFSGLKTALLYQVRGKPQGRGAAATFARTAADMTDRDRRDIAATFQHAAIDALIAKLERAIRRTNPRSVIIGGGVSANSLLRRRTVELGEKHHLPVHLPAMAYCLDNAAMIAGLAFHQLEAGDTADLDLSAVATTGH